MASNPALVRFVNRLLHTRFGTSSALAEAIGMSLSAFSRAVREEGTLSVENCQRLADAIGESPGLILRLCGRHEFAKISDRLYGTNESLTRREREHVALWRKASPMAQDAVDVLLQMNARPAQHSGSVHDKQKDKADKRRLRTKTFHAGSSAG